MSKSVNENSGAFKTDFKKTNPRLMYQMYRAEVISWATSNQCRNEITGPSGLLTWVLTPVEWAAFPPNRTLNAPGVLVIAVIF